MLISKKRYSDKGMREKLQQFSAKFITTEEFESEIGKVLERLKELGYLDDKKFAEDYVADRMRFKPRGKFLLERELGRKGIKKEDREFIGSIDEEEAARRALEGRIKRLSGLTIKEQREKAFRFLASRGFNPDTIYKVVDSCYNRHRQ